MGLCIDGRFTLKPETKADYDNCYPFDVPKMELNGSVEFCSNFTTKSYDIVTICHENDITILNRCIEDDLKSTITIVDLNNATETIYRLEKETSNHLGEIIDKVTGVHINTLDNYKELRDRI